MIRNIFNESHSTSFLIFHIILGLLTSLNPLTLIVWVLGIFVIYLGLLFRTTIKSQIQLTLYLTSFEVIGRMVGASPLIPYEFGKYLTFIFLFSILVRKKTKVSFNGVAMLLLLTPGFFLGVNGWPSFSEFVFNVLGLVNLALAVMVFSYVRISLLDFRNLFRLSLYPLLTVMVFLLFRTPDYSEVDFTLGANSQTSGGFGSNQVSTMLGYAFYIIFMFLLFRWKLTKTRILDIVMLVLFLLQGLLTFSRGGMIGGALSVLVLLYYSGKLKFGKKKVFRGSLITLAITFTIWIADDITGGKLSLRYQGETAGTLAGSKNKDLNTLTTGRFEILMGDLSLFSNHPFLGVGIGASPELRRTHEGTPTHVELGRILAEHGVFGLLYSVVVLTLFMKTLLRRKQTLQKGIRQSLMILSLYTTIHSATRTFITPLLFGLGVTKEERIETKVK